MRLRRGRFSPVPPGSRAKGYFSETPDTHAHTPVDGLHTGGDGARARVRSAAQCPPDALGKRRRNRWVGRALPAARPCHRPVRGGGAGRLVLQLRLLTVRYQAVVLYGEQIGVVGAPVLEGMRDVVAYGAEARAAREVGRAINAEAAALRAFARVSALRVPLVMGCAATRARVAGIGTVVGHSPAPDRRADLRRCHLPLGRAAAGCPDLGERRGHDRREPRGGAQSASRRLAEIIAEAPAPTASAPGLLPEGHDLHVEGVTFAYSAHAEPIVRDLTLRVPASMHLAVVDPSGVGSPPWQTCSPNRPPHSALTTPPCPAGLAARRASRAAPTAARTPWPGTGRRYRPRRRWRG